MGNLQLSINGGRFELKMKLFFPQMEFAKLALFYFVIMTNKTKLCAFTAYVMTTQQISQLCATC